MAIITNTGMSRMRVTVILLAVVIPAAPLKVPGSFLQRHISQRVGLFSSFRKTESTDAPRSTAVRRADMTVVPAGSDWYAVSLRGSGETTLWPSVAIDFLTSCSDFKPLAEHVQEYSEFHALGDDQLREVGRWTGKLVSHRLLADQASVVERCVAAGSGGEESPVRVNAIAIPTAGNEAR